MIFVAILDELWTGAGGRGWPPPSFKNLEIKTKRLAKISAARPAPPSGGAASLEGCALCRRPPVNRKLVTGGIWRPGTFILKYVSNIPFPKAHIYIYPNSTLYGIYIYIYIYKHRL